MIIQKIGANKNSDEFTALIRKGTEREGKEKSKACCARTYLVSSREVRAQQASPFFHFSKIYPLATNLITDTKLATMATTEESIKQPPTPHKAPAKK